MGTIGIFDILVTLAISTVFLWAVIYFITGNSYENWGELFIWVLFFILIGALSKLALIFSSNSIVILSMRLLSALIIGVLLYFLLDLRLGILEAKKKISIAAIFSGGKLVVGLLIKIQYVL